MNHANVVGFIGLGAMGMRMAKRLLELGYNLYAYDIEPSLRQELAEAGAVAAPNPAEVAKETEIIVCMLPTPDALRTVVKGDNGIVTSAHANTIVVDMGTSGPSVDLECAAILSQKGARLIDAPVGKGTWAAGTGDLTILVGGDEETISRAEHILRALGSKIIRCGSLGAGQVTKLANNLASCVNMATLAEVYLLASARGINAEVLATALNGTAADSWHLQNSLPRVVMERFEPGFKVKLAFKDLNLIHDLAEELRLTLPCVEAAIQWFKLALDQGYAELDWSIVAKVARECHQSAARGDV